MDNQGQAAREVNLEDVRVGLLSCFEHAGGILARCAELREHVDGCSPPKEKNETRVAPSSGIVTDLKIIQNELAQRLQQIENLVARTASRLGVPPTPEQPSLAGPRLARG